MQCCLARRTFATGLYKNNGDGKFTALTSNQVGSVVADAVPITVARLRTKIMTVTSICSWRIPGLECKADRKQKVFRRLG